MRRALLVSLILGACGGDDGGAGPDANVPDAQVFAGTPIFMNHDGGHYAPGAEDARENTSSILGAGAVDLGPTDLSDPQWDALLTCVASKFAPFDVTITDVDPGDAPHLEVLNVSAADWPGLGFADGTGGVAPFTCGTIDNAIAIMNPSAFGDDDEVICQVTAQVIASSQGLDHENYCPDLMTYQTGCGDKTFVDLDEPCGEDADRVCQCGGTTQNSYQLLLAAFGAAP